MVSAFNCSPWRGQASASWLSTHPAACRSRSPSPAYIGIFWRSLGNTSDAIYKSPRLARHSTQDAKSNKQTARSSETEAKRLPSWRKRTPHTWSLCSLTVCKRTRGWRVQMVGLLGCTAGIHGRAVASLPALLHAATPSTWMAPLPINPAPT